VIQQRFVTEWNVNGFGGRLKMLGPEVQIMDMRDRYRQTFDGFAQEVNKEIMECVKAWA
jgi:hypothetical protein